MKLTLIGNGFMAQALAKGLIKNFDVEILGRDEKKIKALQEKMPDIKVQLLSDKENIANKNIIFCVKPYALESVAVRLQGEANILFSILAGTTLDKLKKHIDSKYYVRTMPNVAAQISKSTTTITGDKEAKNIALELFNSIGKTIWVNTEKQLDIATAVAGSGPAFLALIAESLVDGSVKAGLERHISKELVEGLFDGFASLLKNNHPALIKDSVMSPGGTTSAGLFELEDGAVRASIIKAVNSAHNKACELGEK
ncbi:MAG: pyrroline-5-carboxylate reductase [Arcobacter sp.]|nr:pyrroline-5-carboxylate reductase [Arcobacter sp.]